MNTLGVDRTLVNQVLSLARRPWDRSVVEDAFARFGWVPQDKDGKPFIPWGDEYFSRHQSLHAGDDRWSGSWLELGNPPPCRSRASFISVRCAYGWPAFGQDPAKADFDEKFEPSEWTGWVRVQDAGPEDLRREYQRLSGLIRDELGNPDRVVAVGAVERQEVWSVVDVEVVLHLGDDLASYSHYDVVAIRVGPRAVWE